MDLYSLVLSHTKDTQGRRTCSEVIHLPVNHNLLAYDAMQTCNWLSMFFCYGGNQPQDHILSLPSRPKQTPSLL
jgi:hypothetical protein